MNLLYIIITAFVVCGRTTDAFDRRHNLLIPPDDAEIVEESFSNEIGRSSYKFNYAEPVQVDPSATNLVGLNLTAPFVVTAIFKSFNGKSSCLFSITQDNFIVLSLCLQPSDKNVTSIELRTELYTPDHSISDYYDVDFKDKWIKIVVFVRDDKADVYVNCNKESDSMTLDKNRDSVLLTKDMKLQLAQSITKNVFEGYIEEINLYTNADDETLKYICNKLRQEELSGPAGKQDDRGDIGPKGDMGSPGPVGIPGMPGSKGDQGSPGPKGERGLYGPVGMPGMTGYKGDRGSPGPKGKDGRDGIPGIPGWHGKPGMKGYKGDLGPQGPIGLHGSIGKKGEEGSCQCTKEIVSSLLLSMPQMKGPAGEPGPPGETGLIDTEKPVVIPGEKGAVGPIGPPGKQGERGVRGEKGPKGDIGPKGEKGVEIKGDKGDRGLTGDPGMPGKVGPQGAPGICSVGPPGPPGQPGIPRKNTKYNLLIPPGDTELVEESITNETGRWSYKITSEEPILVDPSATDLVGLNLTAPFIVTAIFKSYSGQPSCLFSITQDDCTVMRLCIQPIGINTSRVELRTELYSPDDSINDYVNVDFKDKWMKIVVYVRDDKADFYINCSTSMYSQTLGLFKNRDNVTLTKDMKLNVAYSMGTNKFDGLIEEISLRTNADDETLKRACNMLQTVFEHGGDKISENPEERRTRPLEYDFIKDLAECRREITVIKDGMNEQIENITMSFQHEIRGEIEALKSTNEYLVQELQLIQNKNLELEDKLKSVIQKQENLILESQQKLKAS